MEFAILLGFILAVIATLAWVGRHRPGSDDLAVRAHRQTRDGHAWSDFGGQGGGSAG